MDKYSYAGNWHPAIFFIPIVLYFLWLTLRNRCFGVLYANPGLPNSGYFDDSKYLIHQLFAEIESKNLLATEILAQDLSVERKIVALKEFIARNGLAFPIILKPDKGLRGIGVKIIHEIKQARAYFEMANFDVIMQEHCNYQNEGCIYFYRDPDTDRCEILGSTIKTGPTFIGDGVSTLNDIIDRTPYVCHVKSALVADANLDLQHVLAKNEVFTPNVTPCISVGAKFSSANHLISSSTQQWMQEMTDGLSRRGVKIGRFDIKYRDNDAFRTGNGLKIIELNGVSAELNELYDTKNSPVEMYRIYFKQLRFVFWIGRRNLESTSLPYISKLGFLSNLRQFTTLKSKMILMDELGYCPDIAS